MGYGQTSTDNIRLNQIGFYPHATKKAVVMGDVSGSFYLITSQNQDTVYTGTLGAARKSPFANKISHLADFSDFRKTGEFMLAIPGHGVSNPFKIGDHVLKNVADASLKAFYFIRSSTDLPKKYAGKWSRAEGTPDQQVYIHASAASDQRPENSVISAPKGWYDAGDYNKYVVNSGISTATLLSLYEDFPTFSHTIEIQIPEQGNKIPDLLDETLWNLRWMLSMQDPNDGGVYHKLTFAHFTGMVMPDQAKGKRYVVQKSTAAALDFAAVMAQAARVLKSFQGQLPGLTDSCLVAAKQAWNWAQKHPDAIYDQRKLNQTYDPDITTGAYGDRHLDDEWIWAASELWITTRDAQYAEAVDLVPDEKMPLPSWGQVRLLGYYSLLRDQSKLTDNAKSMVAGLRKRLISFADELVARANRSGYDTPMGSRKNDFVWGSNAVAANEGIALVQAYKLTSQPKYLEAAQDNLDYLLGRNGTGYSFVTGYGDKTPMHIHHRPSEEDGVEDPVPGLLAGGPNPGRQDGCKYETTVPDEAYLDSVCSYSTNEIAINWNAPLVYLSQAIEALRSNENSSTH